MRRNELTAIAILLLPLIVGLGMLIVATYPVNILIISMLYVCGLIDLVYAKIPLIRHGVFNSLGPSRIPSKRRDAYYRGYKRISFGASINVLVLLHHSMSTGLS